MRPIVVVIFLLCSTFVVPQANGGYISGLTRDCFAGKLYRPTKVDIYLLDPARSPEVVKILQEMQQDLESSRSNDPKSIKPFFAAYGKFQKAIGRTAAISRAKSDQRGAFTFRTLKAGRRLLVVGIADREDGTSFYAQQAIDSLHTGRNSILLDFDPKEACQ